MKKIKFKTKKIKILILSIFIGCFLAVPLMSFGCSHKILDLSSIKIDESKVISNNNFAVFYAYNPREVSLTETFLINEDNYVCKVVQDALLEVDKNFDFSKITITNTAPISYEEDKEIKYYDYTFDPLRDHFQQCDIFVQSNCAEYQGEFSFKVNVCAITRTSQFIDKDFTHYKLTSPVPLKLPTDSSQPIDKDAIEKYIKSSINDDNSPIHKVVANLYTSEYKALRSIDVFCDEEESLKININSVSDNGVDCTIEFKAKLNLNYDGKNSVLNYTTPYTNCKLDLVLISSITDFSNLDTQIRDLINTTFIDGDDKLSTDMLVANPSRVYHKSIEEWINNKISDGILKILKDNYQPYKILGNIENEPNTSDFKVSVRYNALDHDLDYYNLTTYKYFSIIVSPSETTKKFIGSPIGEDQTININIKAINKSKNLFDFEIQQNELLNFGLIPGESATYVPKKRLLNITEVSSEFSNIIDNLLVKFSDDCENLVRKENSTQSGYYDYTLQIVNVGSLPDYIDMSQGIELGFNIIASNDSIYLRGNKHFTYWFKTNKKPFDLQKAQIQLSDNYNFYALTVSECTDNEIESLCNNDKLISDISDSLYSAFFKNSIPKKFLHLSEQFEISITYDTHDFSRNRNVDISINALSNSLFFYGNISEIKIVAYATQTVFSLANLLFTEEIELPILIFGTADNKITQEQIDAMNVRNLGNERFDSVKNYISNKVKTACEQINIDVDYQVVLELNPDDKYDDSHPVVIGKLVPLNTSKVVDSTNIKFKVKVSSYKETSTVIYSNRFHFLNNSTYVAEQAHYSYWITQGVGMWSTKNDNASLHYERDSFYCAMHLTYIHEGLDNIKEYDKNDLSTLYTLNQLVEKGIVVQTLNPNVPSEGSYLYYQIPNTSLKYQYQSGRTMIILPPTNVFNSDPSGYYPYDLTTRQVQKLSYKKEYKDNTDNEKPAWRRSWLYNINITTGKAVYFCKIKKDDKWRLHIIMSSNESEKTIIKLGDPSTSFGGEIISEWSSQILDSSESYLIYKNI